MRDFTGTPEEQAKAIAAVSDAVSRAELNMEWRERKSSLEQDIKEAERQVAIFSGDLCEAEISLRNAVTELNEHLESAPR